MSFKVKKKVKGTIYIYESKGYWDKEKKQSRHKRIYLGKLDEETGEIIPAKQTDTPKFSRTYGNFYLFNNLAEKTGLSEILKTVFLDKSNEILTCAFYELVEKKAWYLLEEWSEETINFCEKNLTSQKISDLLKSISDESKMAFFTNWGQIRTEQECIAFDITSISSYSNLIEIVENGYNRDGEDLSQINLGMLFGETSLLPIFYTVYPGSIKDVKTISNMLKLAEFLKLSKMKFVLDKGFFSTNNIDEILTDKNNYQFTVSVPFSTSFAKEAISLVKDEINSPNNTIMVNSDIIQAVTKNEKWKNKKLYVHTYFNRKKYAIEESEFLKKILQWEQELKTENILMSNENNYKKYFITKKTQKGTNVKRKEEAILETLKNKGFLVILSNNIKTAQEALSVYRNKDAVEKAFDNMKNELDLDRLRIHSEKSMNGRIFIAFIALIIQSQIHRVMKEKDLYKNYTVEKLLSELKKIKKFELSSGKTMLSEISKKQRDIFKAFEITEPK